MPVPINTPVEYRGTVDVLEANGAAITSGSIVQADDANYDTATDGEGLPDAEFTLSFTYGTAPTEGTTLALYARPLDVDGTGDTEVPEASRPTRFIGVFVVNNVTTLQYAILTAFGLPKLASYYIHNNGTGQTVSAGWVLKVTPYALTPKV